MDKNFTELSQYLNQVMQERNLSIRGFATYANLAHATVRRILAGDQVDMATLNKIANYLNLPPDTVYKMAGALPAEEEQRGEIIRVIEHLIAKLPESDQQEILDIVRMKVARQDKAKS